jgi:hypothetical protein
VEGHSRGRWERNTLVVEVTNQNGFGEFDNTGNYYTDQVRIIERWTLLDRDTLRYEATIEDASIYERPWTLSFDLARNRQPNFEVWEPACFEGNRMFDVIRSTPN